MVKFTQDIDLETLRSLLSYDPDTGIFRWRNRQRKIGGFIDAGSIAGFKEILGYWCVGLNKKTYKCHRLAWLYFYEEWPSNNIDHINCDRSDNRICNLRLGDRKVNPFNQRVRINNTSGHKGITITPYGKFIARIGVRRSRIYLGTFDSLEEAHAAYAVAAPLYHGEFARVE